MEFSENCDVIMAKFAEASQTVTNPVKGKTNPHLKNKYADLAAVHKAIRAAIEHTELTIIQEPVFRDGFGKDVLLMRTTILHAKSQQWMASTCAVPMQKLDPQGFGSTLKYSRRYALTAIFSMSESDDDGQGAVKTQAAWKRELSQAENRQEIGEVLKAVKAVNDPTLLRVMQSEAGKRQAELDIGSSEGFTAPISNREKIKQQQPVLSDNYKEEDF